MSDQPVRDSHLRSALKALSWRFVATFTTIVITFIVTGRIDAAITVGSVEFVAKFLIYYGHERAWALVPPDLWRRRGAPAGPPPAPAATLPETPPAP